VWFQSWGWVEPARSLRRRGNSKREPGELSIENHRRICFAGAVDLGAISWQVDRVKWKLDGPLTAGPFLSD